MHPGSSPSTQPHRDSPGAGPAASVAAAVLILCLGVGVVLPEIGERSARQRDAQRLTRLARVRDAIEQFRLDHGRFPAAQGRADLGGWDVSHDGDFVPELVNAGYLKQRARDPLDDDRHHLLYRLHPAGTFGATAAGPYYVLGLRNYESRHYAHRRPGQLQAGHGDWSGELAWVTGGSLRQP